MKRTIFTVTIMSLMLVSCEKNEFSSSPKPVEVSFTVTSENMVKSGGNSSTDESKVNDLQLFVFDSSGILQDYSASGAVMETTLVCTEGRKTIWALVNAPSMKDVMNLEDLKSRTVDLALDNEADSFVMSGYTEADLVDKAEIPVVVKRLVGKVSIKKISVNFTTPANRQKKFTIECIYIINAAADCNVSVGGMPVTWYNKLVHADTSADKFLFRQIGEEVSMTKPFDRDVDFYVFPNPVEEKSYSETFSPRQTMLVVEAVLGNERVYYSIDLPVIERNRVYTVEELEITRKGSDEPWKPVVTGSGNVRINVDDWELGLNIGKITI